MTSLILQDVNSNHQVCRPVSSAGKQNMSTATGVDRLNIYLQERGQLAALSWEMSWTGPANAKTWTAVCKLNGQSFGKASAPLKNGAKNLAADIAWNNLTQNA
ncbi:hypothetical protein HYPSUDRAFT_62245 [Hypholoma sublateritium FD-334 SS-4]|uniref:DRBM domain-containing protein n=1 Tax=Hypholoma sublateritium (strain FD-334 SS-4) TaxID=945553 RepID=A0A0D2PJN4_HYPSF|nr:hypothetical protein HYPSUDRAFT_62245 [Hypholoma sublateritium FD-334 SS-4]